MLAEWQGLGIGNWGGGWWVKHGSPLCHGIAVARIGLRFCSLDNND